MHCKGIHSTFVESPDCCFGEESVRVYIDEDKIIYGGGLGPPPTLPDHPRKILMATLTEVAPLFLSRDYDWVTSKLPFFDNAYSSVLRPGLNDNLVRRAFLNFFAAIFKDYRKYLIYGTTEDPDPMNKFMFHEFIRGKVYLLCSQVSNMSRNVFWNIFVRKRKYILDL